MYGADDNSLPVIQTKKTRRPSSDFSKLMINIGRSHRIAPNFIVGAIAERTSLSGGDIGKIEIYDEHTLVEVPKQEEQQVLEAMEGCKINGMDTVTRKWFTKEDRKPRGDRPARTRDSGKAHDAEISNDDERSRDDMGGEKKPFRKEWSKERDHGKDREKDGFFHHKKDHDRRDRKDDREPREQREPKEQRGHIDYKDKKFGRKDKRDHGKGGKPGWKENKPFRGEKKSGGWKDSKGHNRQGGKRDSHGNTGRSKKYMMED